MKILLTVEIIPLRMIIFRKQRKYERPLDDEEYDYCFIANINTQQ